MIESNLKKQTKITKTAIGLSININRLNEIDEIRGDLTRSTFITRLIDIMFDKHLDEIQNYIERNNTMFRRNNEVKEIK